MEDVQWLPIERIKPLFSANVTRSFLNRANQAKRHLTTFDKLLPVEENGEDYVLVGNYDRYFCLKNYSSTEPVPCMIENQTNTVQRYLKVLRRLYYSGDALKKNKKAILAELKNRRVLVDMILEHTGLTKADLNKFEYNPYIPSQFILPESSELVLNWIAAQTFNGKVKAFLYERANEPVGSPLRLTTSKVKTIKNVLAHVSGFSQLNANQQINVLKRIMVFKGELIYITQIMISEYINDKNKIEA